VKAQHTKIREELLAVLLSLALAIIKGTAAFYTGALTLLASALDSLLDFLVSSLNLFVLVVAHKAPDADHPFGHEKAEALGGLFQSFFILVSAAYLFYSSYERLHHPFELSHLGWGMAVIVLSILVSLVLTLRLKKAAHQTGSIVLKTDSLHYAIDLYSYGAVLIALALIQFSGWPLWDPILTFPLALYIAYQGASLGKEAIDELMDRESSPETLETVQKIVQSYAPQVVGMHNFKTRRAGNRRFIQFHVEIKHNLSFEKVHQITENLVADIRRAVNNAHVIIHPDPEGHGLDESDLM